MTTDEKIDSLSNGINQLLALYRQNGQKFGEMALAMSKIAEGQTETSQIAMAQERAAQLMRDRQSLRDFYAKEFMLRLIPKTEDPFAGTIADWGPEKVQQLARKAYVFADAVLAVRDSSLVTFDRDGLLRFLREFAQTCGVDELFVQNFLSEKDL